MDAENERREKNALRAAGEEDRVMRGKVANCRDDVQWYRFPLTEAQGARSAISYAANLKRRIGTLSSTIRTRQGPGSRRVESSVGRKSFQLDSATPSFPLALSEYPMRIPMFSRRHLATAPIKSRGRQMKGRSGRSKRCRHAVRGSVLSCETETSKQLSCESTSTERGPSCCASFWKRQHVDLPSPVGCRVLGLKGDHSAISSLIRCHKYP